MIDRFVDGLGTWVVYKQEIRSGNPWECLSSSKADGRRYAKTRMEERKEETGKRGNVLATQIFPGR